MKIGHQHVEFGSGAPCRDKDFDISIQSEKLLSGHLIGRFIEPVSCNCYNERIACCVRGEDYTMSLGGPGYGAFLIFQVLLGYQI